MFFGRRVAIFCVALVVGIMTWGVVGGVSAAPLLSAAGSPTTTNALSDTTTTTVKANITTTTVRSDTTSTTVKSDTTTTTITKRDLCPNIDGVQTTIPVGMFVNARGECVPRIVDLCPNLDNVQATIPTGMFINKEGDCVPRIVDLCSNIPGIQATVPAGMFRTANGKCFRRVADVIGTSPDPAFKDTVADQCVIGGTGPGGGIVFYKASSPQPWGRCLEAAPNTWSGNTSDSWGLWKCYGLNIPGASGTAIGTGKANTNAITANCADQNAARQAKDLIFGGKSDWFLPSIGELLKMYAMSSVIGGFDANTYWSSTQLGVTGAWSQVFGAGTYYGPNRLSIYSVRPIRAFG